MTRQHNAIAIERAEIHRFEVLSVTKTAINLKQEKANMVDHRVERIIIPAKFFIIIVVCLSSTYIIL
jgi:hypothetical protein